MTNRSNAAVLRESVEYVIGSCNSAVATDGCFDTKRPSLSMPTGGDVIYGVTHQHTGGTGSAL
ncbi:hypothetical protein RJ640_021445 [Escallonia rubra]|uniref:Uncharacterized protein n=1 Tax=Escallonia rubra TaxID=112253 RepID=A0AA88QY22_9ASTE|nr:hypothetical protein RJ640_021445 [Escallonia rubra]